MSAASFAPTRSNKALRVVALRSKGGIGLGAKRGVRAVVMCCQDAVVAAARRAFVGERRRLMSSELRRGEGGGVEAMSNKRERHALGVVFDSTAMGVLEDW